MKETNNIGAIVMIAVSALAAIGICTVVDSGSSISISNDSIEITNDNYQIKEQQVIEQK